MDGRHQSLEVPQGEAQERQMQQPKQQYEQQQQQSQQQQPHGQHQQFHGQHQRRYRPHYEQRMQHHHNRVPQFQCRSHAFRQHQEGKRGNNDAGFHSVCEAKSPHALHRQRSFADKVPETAPLKARNRFARSRSTPWSLDETDHSKAKLESVEGAPQLEGLTRAPSYETTAEGEERCRGKFPAAARLRRLHSYGSVDTSSRCNQTGNAQTNINGFNRRNARYSSHNASHNAHRGVCAAGSNHSGNWCGNNNNVTTTEGGNTSCSNGTSKGTHGNSQLRAFYKKSVSFDCSLDLESKTGVCNVRKDGYSKLSVQQSGAQEEHDSNQAVQQSKAAEGCESSSVKESRCCCASESQHRQPDRSRFGIGFHNSEKPPACFQQQAQLQQHHQQQKHVQLRTLQQQKMLQPSQQARQQARQQQHHDQEHVEQRETAVSPERAPTNNLASELVPSQQLLLTEQPRLSEDRIFSDSCRSEQYLHSPAQRRRPSALHDRQHQQQPRKQNHQQQSRPKQCKLTQDIHTGLQQNRDCLPPAYYPLQWPPPPPSVLYCQQLQQLQAGASNFYENEVNPCPDPLFHRLLLHVPGKLCVSSQHMFSGSAGPPALLPVGVSAVQGDCVRDTCEVLERRLCLPRQKMPPFSSVSAPQSSTSPSVLSPRPAEDCDFSSSDGMPFYFPTPPDARSNPPAVAAASSPTYLATHTTTNDGDSLTTLTNDDGSCIPPTQWSYKTWTAAAGSSFATRHSSASYLADAPLGQRERQPATGGVCLKHAGNSVESVSGSDASVTENTATASQRAGGVEPFQQAAAAGSSQGYACGTLAGVTACIPTDAACTSTVEETPDKISVRATPAAVLHACSCNAGCLRSAVAPVPSGSNPAPSELAVRNEPGHEEDGLQCGSSGSDVRPCENTTYSTARGVPVPSRFHLAFPPKDPSLLLPPGAPLVAVSSGTTNGEVDNKEHDYIARQYEFIFPDHVLAVAGPIDTSAHFSRPTGSTSSISLPGGVDTRELSASAPTAVAAVSTAATGSSGCAAAPSDPGESVVDSAASGVLLTSTAQLAYQSNLCSAAATQITTEGTAHKATVKECVLNTVHAAARLPPTLLLQRERPSNKEPAAALQQQSNIASGVKQTSSYTTRLVDAGREVTTSSKKLEFTLCTRQHKETMYSGGEQAEVQRAGDIETGETPGPWQNKEKEAGESATTRPEMEEKQRGVGSCTEGPEGVPQQCEIPATIAALGLQKKAKSLPARGYSCSKRRTLGDRAGRGQAPECLARIVPAATSAELFATHQGAQHKPMRCASNTTVSSAYGKTEQPCGSPLEHANQNAQDAEQETQTTMEKWNFAPDGGTQLNVPATASIIPEGGPHRNERSGEIEVRETDASGESNKSLLQQRPRCSQERSTSQQEAHRCGQGGARAVCCETCSTPNGSSPSDSNSCRRCTSNCGSRRRHTLHYYQVLRLLGRGTFGHVYECLQYDACSGEAVAAVAVKIVKNDEAYTRSAMQEIAILRQLNGDLCRCKCNCKTIPAGVINGEGNKYSSSCLRADAVKTVSSGGGRDESRVPSHEEQQCPLHQNGARLQPQEPERQQEQSEQEVMEQLNAELGERRVVKLLDDFTHCGHTCLVFELLQTDLYQLLKQNRFSGFPLLAVKQVCREMLQGVAHLKRTRIVHCDIKPENILVRFSGALPLPQQQGQWHQPNLQRQHYCSKRPFPLQKYHQPSLQLPQQQEPHLLHETQRNTAWRSARAAEETTQQRQPARTNVSHAAPSVSSAPPQGPELEASAKVSTSFGNLLTEAKSTQCAGVYGGSSRSPTGKAGTAAVTGSGTGSSKSTVATPVPDQSSPLGMYTAPCGHTGKLLLTRNSNPSPKYDKRLALLPELHAIKQPPARSAEACLSLPKMTHKGRVNCSKSHGCFSAVFQNQPLSTRAAVSSPATSPECRNPAVSSSQCNAGSMPRITDTPTTGGRKNHTAAANLQDACAVAPPPAATAAASSPATREKVQMAAGGISHGVAAPNVAASALASPAAHLSISVKLVDFSSAYPLPPCPQPDDPAAIEVLEQEQASHPAAPYLYAQSRFYGAPEVMLGVRYMMKLDVWAVGCVAAELYSGKPLLPGATDFDQMRRLVALRGMPPAWMLRVGRRTSLYFARDKQQRHKQRQVKEAEGDEQRRRQQKDEEEKQHEQHQSRRQQHSEGMSPGPQEKQHVQRTQKGMQQRQHGTVVRQKGADGYKAGDDEETKERRDRDQELEQQQEPSMGERNRQAEKAGAEGAAQVSLLNRSCGAAGETAAARAFFRGDRWGALSAAPCGLSRRQIQAWWHRILIAVSSRSIVEKKSQHDAYSHHLPAQQLQRQQNAEAAPQQRQHSVEAEQQHQQGREQSSQADAPSVVHRQHPDERCQATAVREKQQQQASQYAGTMEQKLKTGGTEEGSEEAADGGRKECRERGRLVDRVPDVGRCAQNAAGKDGSENKAAHGRAVGDESSGRHRLWEALGEADVAQTSNEGQEQSAEDNSDADSDESRCDAEENGWRLKTTQEVEEGMSSREETPRGAPVLRSLQELVALRHRRERLRMLEMRQNQAKQTNNGQPSVDQHIRGRWWPTTGERVSRERAAGCRHPPDLDATICNFQPHTSDDAKIQPGSVQATSEQSSGVPDACARCAQVACEQLCMSLKNSLTGVHSAAGASGEKMTASGNAYFQPSSCMKDAGTETALRVKNQSGEGCLHTCATRGGCTQAASLTSDISNQERQFSPTLGSGGVSHHQEERVIMLDSEGDTRRKITAAPAAAKGSNNENDTSTGTAHQCFSSRSQLRQAPSEQLKISETMHSQEFRLVDEEKRRCSSAAVKGFLCADSSALTCTASPNLSGSLVGSSAAASFAPAGLSTSMSPKAPPKGGCAAADVANSPIVASAPSSPSRGQGECAAPPVAAAESPHQTSSAAATTTTPPQATGTTRNNFPKRASRFFKMLMKGRTSRPSSSSCSAILCSKTDSPPHIAPTNKQAGSSTRGKNSPRNSASSPPSALRGFSAFYCPLDASPLPAVGHNGAAVSSPVSTLLTAHVASTQHKAGQDGDAHADASSASSSGVGTSIAPPTSAAASTVPPVFSCSAVDFSSAPSSSNNAAAEHLRRLQPCSMLCSAPPLHVHFPAAPTMKARPSCSAVSPVRCYSNSVDPFPVLPAHLSSSSGPAAAAPAPHAHVPGALLRAAPCVTAAAVGSPALAALASHPPTAASSASIFDTVVAHDASPCPGVPSSSHLPAPGGAAAPPLRRSASSCSVAARLLSSSFPPFPRSGGQLLKNTSMVSTACSTTACSCCSLPHTDAAAADPTAVVDARAAAAAAGAAAQQKETETSTQAEPLPASPDALAMAEREAQAEEARQEQLFLDFLDGMLEIDPFKRFTVEEALRHPFIAEDFHVVPTVAGNLPTAAVALPGAATPPHQGITTAASYPAGERRQIAARAPPATAASPPAAGEFNTTEAPNAAAHAVAPGLKPEKNAAVQQEEHNSRNFSELDVVQSSNVQPARLSASPATRDARVAPATTSKTPTTSSGTLRAADLLTAPLLRGNLHLQESPSLGDTVTHKSVHFAPRASAWCATSSSRSVGCCCYCRQRCCPAATQGDATVPHCTDRAAAAPVTLLPGATAASNGISPPGVAFASGATGNGASVTVAGAAALSGADATAAAGVNALAAGVDVAAPPVTLCPAVDCACLSPACLRERAVDVQYRIWSSRRFKKVVERLREDAASHHKPRTAAKQLATAAVEREALKPYDAGRKQQQSSPHKQRAHAGNHEGRRGAQHLAAGEREGQEMRSKQDQQDSSAAAAFKRTQDEADATKEDNEGCHMQQCSMSKGSSSRLRECLLATSREQEGMNGPPDVIERCARIPCDAASCSRSNGLILSDSERSLSEDSPHLNPAAGAGAAAVTTGGVDMETKGIHSNLGCYAHATNVRHQVQDALLLHRLQNVLQEEALKARHLREQQALRRKQLTELQELRRKRRVTLPIRNVPCTKKNFPKFLHKDPADT